MTEPSAWAELENLARRTVADPYDEPDEKLAKGVLDLLAELQRQRERADQADVKRDDATIWWGRTCEALTNELERVRAGLQETQLLVHASHSTHWEIEKCTLPSCVRIRALLAPEGKTRELNLLHDPEEIDWVAPEGKTQENFELKEQPMSEPEYVEVGWLIPDREPAFEPGEALGAERDPSARIGFPVYAEKFSLDAWYQLLADRALRGAEPEGKEAR